MNVFGLMEIAQSLPTLCREKFFHGAPYLDAVVTTDPAHIGYLGGYRSLLQDVMPYPQAVIATRERALLVTGASDAAAALESLRDPQSIWRYGTFYVNASEGHIGYEDMPPAGNTFSDTLHIAIASLRLSGSRVGLDVRDAAVADSVRSALPELHFTDAGIAFRLSRATKLPGELALLRHASKITDNAIKGIMPMISAGVTELEIAGAITGEMVRHGGIPRFVVVTSGERSALVDAYARPKRIEAGDLVRLDIGCSVEGYCSDMARTLTAGTPTEKQQSRYDALLAGQRAEIAALRPNATTGDIYRAAMETVRQAALPGYQRTHCGHGIGLRSHEYPPLNADSDVLIEQGMVFCVETPYYELGWGGMMVEDTVIITENGCELLTGCSRQLCQS